jgi:FkbM family methyltransferase
MSIIPDAPDKSYVNKVAALLPSQFALARHMIATDNDVVRDLIPCVEAYLKESRVEAPVIFDVGCNVGSVSRVLIEKFPGASVHLFEPVFTYLKIAAMRMEDLRSKASFVARMNNMAVGDECGQLAFFKTKDLSGSSSAYHSGDSSFSLEEQQEDWFKENGIIFLNKPDPSGGQHSSSVESTTVPVVTLDSYCAAPSNEISKIDLLKVDTEGMEAKVILGAKETLKKYHPLIHMEVGWGKKHPDWDDHVEAFEYLFSIGYKKFNYNEIESTANLLIEPQAHKDYDI